MYGATRGEVQDKLREALHDRDRGLPAPGRTPTVEGFLTQWLASVGPSLRPKTYVSYEGTVRLHIVPRLGKVQLRRLTPAMIQGVLAAKLDSGQSPQSVKYVLKVLRIALGQAQRWDLVGRNVAVLLDGPRVPHRTLQVLSPEECRRFLESIDGTRQEAPFTLALALGLRRGEPLGLRWADADLEGRRLVVGAALQRISGCGPQLMETKTARGRRVVTLPRVCVRVLRTQRVRQVQDKLLAGAGGDSNP